MKTTRILTQQLRNENPYWTVCTLPGGSKNPLVLSGVLIWGERLHTIDCDDCHDCDFMPTPYVRDETAEKPQWAYTCELTGEVIDVDAERVFSLVYDPDRFAAIVCERLECEGVEKIGDGKVWRLGHSDIAETQEREIVIMTRCGKADLESLPKLLQNQNFLLLVGSLECDLTQFDDQYRRRIYTFDQVVRFADDGTVSFVLDEFTNRLSESVVPKKRGKRADTLARERKIAEYLKDRFFSIMSLPTWEEREKAIRETKNVAEIGRELNIPKNTMIRYLNAKWHWGDDESCAQFWFNVVTVYDYFFIFAKIVEEKPFSAGQDAQTLYGNFYRLYLAEMARHKSAK